MSVLDMGPTLGWGVVVAGGGACGAGGALGGFDNFDFVGVGGAGFGASVFGGGVALTALGGLTGWPA